MSGCVACKVRLYMRASYYGRAPNGSPVRGPEAREALLARAPRAIGAATVVKLLSAERRHHGHGGVLGREGTLQGFEFGRVLGRDVGRFTGIRRDVEELEVVLPEVDQPEMVVEERAPGRVVRVLGELGEDGLA